MKPLIRLVVLGSMCVALGIQGGSPGRAVAAERLGEEPAQPGDEATLARPESRRMGPVRIDGHALADDGGPFLGLGASYFTALWRLKHDRPRLEADLAFLASQGFDYYRMLSMVGHHPAWDGLEIAPVSFVNRDDKRVEAWPDYWRQLGELIDLAYDRFGLRTQITIFADAQLMPRANERRAHMRTLLAEVVPGREQKIILLEVANEAWQNGFPGDQGVADLREFAAYLGSRTEIPVAITSNHDWPELGSSKGFEQVYAGRMRGGNPFMTAGSLGIGRVSPP